MTEYRALTCIELRHGNTGFVTLVDGGSNASCITLNSFKPLNVPKFVNFEEISAKSWDNKSCNLVLGT